MKLFVNGTCRSRGPGSWPYYLQQLLDSDLVNFSISGSGGPYIYETTVTELSKRHYDLVVVMWGLPHHTSVKVNDIFKYADSQHTSLYESEQNDWPEKITYPINDQDYVDKNWILGIGQHQGSCDSVAKFFEMYHNTVKFKQLVESDLIRIISLQSYLKCKAQPYVFLYGETHHRWKQFSHLYEQIDWSNWYLDVTIRDVSEMNEGKWKATRPGPVANPEGHAYYAKLLASHIKAKKLDR